MTNRPWTIFGPFDLDRNDKRSWPKLFQETIEQAHPGLTTAIGVYVIGLKNPVNDKIKYIGMTYAQHFNLEIFSQRNMKEVWPIIEGQKSKTVRIWLLAKSNPNRKGYSGATSLYRQAHLLEELLIMHARAAGHALINTKKMKSADGIAVKGLFGKRKKGVKSKAIRTMAGALRLQS